jgi:hypothetical protein
MTRKRVLFVVIAVFVLPYAWAPVYQFPDPTPFSGSRFYNPYAQLSGLWKRANLHAHGTAWGGITNGQQPSEEVAQKYRALGYDVPGVSNYQAIAAHDGVDTLPLYEHGYNIAKRHQLAIGAHQVEWFDFPLWQLLSQRQYVIDRVRATADLVGLTHPATRDAYSDGSLDRLTGYQFVEIVNGPFETPSAWDDALSSGHVVWAMANDDSHDIGDPGRTGTAWNMIDAASTSHNDVVAALKAGRTYAVARRSGSLDMDVSLAGVEVSDGLVSVTTAGAPVDIEFIGQHGTARHHQDGPTASYTFGSHDTYVRAVIRSPRTTLYLNPVMRYDGVALPAPVATIDNGRTWLLRAMVALGLAVCGMLLWPLGRREEETPRASALPHTDRETT